MSYPRSKHKMKQRLHLCAGEIVVSPCAPRYYAHFLASRPEFSNFKVGHSKLRGITPNFEIKKKIKRKDYFIKFFISSLLSLVYFLSAARTITASTLSKLNSVLRNSFNSSKPNFRPSSTLKLGL